MAFHESIEYSPQSSRVVTGGHEHNGTKLMLVAPCCKRLAFTFGSGVGCGDLNDIGDAKQSQLANLPRGRVLVRKPLAAELIALYTRRGGKNRNLRRNAASHEVCRFEYPRAAGISRYDDDARRRDRLAEDERPSCGSQKRFSNGGNRNDGSRGQCDYH